MPNYDYECKHCNKHFEIFQSMNDEHIKVCPECGKSGFKRLIGSGAGVIFKGSGFYATDYAKSNSPVCGRDRPCCGRDTPCDSKPCEP